MYFDICFKVHYDSNSYTDLKYVYVLPFIRFSMRISFKYTRGVKSSYLLE